MEFLNSWAFFLLLIIPLLFLIKGKKFSFNKKIIISSFFNKKKRFYLFLTAYLFLIIALARPVVLNSTQKVKISNLNIVVLLDISKGMKCKDIYPNRFEAAVNKLKKLFTMLKYQNVAVILVSNEPYLLSPLTNDYPSIIYLLTHLNKKELFISNLSDFKKAFDSAKSIAQEPKIYITISYKAPKHPNTINYIMALKNCMVDSQLYLKAQNGIEFTYSDEDIKQIAAMVNKLSKSKEIKIKNQKELFYYPLLLAIILIFIGTFSLRVKK